MTDSVAKVGDVVAWDNAPSNAMLEWDHIESYITDASGRARLFNGGVIDRVIWIPPSTPVMIIALGLNGDEGNSELRALAEVFHRDHSAA